MLANRSILRLLALLILMLLLAPALPAQQHAGARHASGGDVAPARVRLYKNLGDHKYPITTKNPKAQRYFDQGLRLTWAFNHPEAIRSFAEGERLDSTCAMCAWGIAYASGPNINLGMDSTMGAQAYAAIQRAHRNAGRVTGRERALIDALATRYAANPETPRAALDSAWAIKIGEVADRFGDDHESQVFHADAIMNLSPWNYWNANGTPRAGTMLMLDRLDRVLVANRKHPGACHLYIHAVEATDPARALECAERLASLMPGAGHIVHMPGHIYIRLGRYDDAIRLNQHAAHADGQLLEGPGVARRGIYANGYYPHNFHFLSFAASMTGRSRMAIDAARETATRLSLESIRAVPWTESVTAIVPQTLVTFGRWDEILAEPAPGDSIPFFTGMTWYARGVAYAAKADEPNARRMLARLKDVAESFPKNDNGTALAIAVQALQGEIALRGAGGGKPKDAVRFFTEATRLEGTLYYNEPPTWYYPMRQSLGKALLAAGDAVGAERVYREDLKRFPENGWSLIGLVQSLEAQGKSKVVEAGLTRAVFDAAWKNADVKLTSSRF